jgi:hypothetical protein
MSTALFCVITQRVVVISYRRFGTTDRSDLQYSKILTLFTIEDEFERLSRKTSIINCHYSLRKYLEVRSSQAEICYRIQVFSCLRCSGRQWLIFTITGIYIEFRKLQQTDLKIYFFKISSIRQE